MDDTAIRLEGVTKAFGGRKVLDDVTLDVRRKSGFCLLGRSGTGKSVTLKHIIGLMHPDRGRVLVEGRDVTVLGRRELAEVRRRMGFLFQNSALFDSITVGENVAFPMRRHTDSNDKTIRESARAKLADVGLENEYDKMPADLSGGMRKRVALARSIALAPQAVLYDEPTTGLDPITATAINRLIRGLQARLGITSVVVTHDIQSAFHVADRIAFLYEGKISFTGTPQEAEASREPLLREFLRGGVDA